VPWLSGFSVQCTLFRFEGCQGFDRFSVASFDRFSVASPGLCFWQAQDMDIALQDMNIAQQDMNIAQQDMDIALQDMDIAHAAHTQTYQTHAHSNMLCLRSFSSISGLFT
jgi:hypothetical protein